ncbi:glycosyltransferase family 4 protein [Allopusillimonas ginsengisoli]|uniref:glycosyltransferase family 4 protein n=1 Tax=Allopusillimonas ginsengisoli TaxID=453575 RepID=UPI00101FD2EE|nr:glycosyltransferase family 4 protein [Allopusillimonas ginsengisoli]TEA78627.1 glycosyltransferase family 1 protein [Allopusillimonas ginsengisoli]
MKFLLVASYAESITQFRGPFIQALIAKGMEVHIAAPGLSRNSTTRHELESRGLATHDIALRRTGMNPLRDLFTLWVLWRLMMRLQPDFVMGYTIKPVIYGTLAAWLARVPHRYALITGLGYAFAGKNGEGSRPGLCRRVAQALYTTALGHAHKTFFQNPDDEQLFRSLGILHPSAKTVVINGSGINLKQFAPAPLPQSPHFLLVARLLRNKGVREYCEAAMRIHRQHPHTRFTLVGWLDDNPDSVSQQELEGWLAQGHLDFLGRLDDVRPAIAACNVYVLPSYREGTPRTVLEAMSMGRAVITTDAPGCRETVINGHNGYLIPVQCVDSLTAAMQHFVDDPGLARRMGAYSRRIAEHKYDVGKVNAVMLREMGIGFHHTHSHSAYKRHLATVR